MWQPGTTAEFSSCKSPWGWEGGVHPPQPHVWLSTLCIRQQFARQSHAGLLGQTPVSLLGIEISNPSSQQQAGSSCFGVGRCSGRNREEGNKAARKLERDWAAKGFLRDHTELGEGVST